MCLTYLSLFPSPHPRDEGCLRGCCCHEVTNDVSPGLHVPIMAMALEGIVVSLLSRAAHSQVHHDNCEPFRGNYQRVALHNQFPSALGTTFTKKGKRKQRADSALGWDNTLLGSSSSTSTFKSKLNNFNFRELMQTVM